MSNIEQSRLAVLIDLLGTCVPDSRKLPEETIAYARTNLLMDESVQNYFGAPLAVHSGADHFTQISVDAQVNCLLIMAFISI